MEAKPKFPWVITCGIIVGFMGNLWVCYLASFLLKLPAGGDYRLMAYAAYTGLTAIITLLIGLPLSIYHLRQSNSRLNRAFGILGILLSLFPFPLSDVLMRLIAQMHGWTLAD